MKALTYIEHGKFALLGKPLSSRDAVARATLGNICTSDLHIKHGSVPQAVSGITMKPGDRMTVNAEAFCGECFFQHGFVNNGTDPNGVWTLQE